MIGPLLQTQCPVCCFGGLTVAVAMLPSGKFQCLSCSHEWHETEDVVDPDQTELPL